MKRRLAGMVGTAPESMRMLLDVLDVDYGGAEAYLRLIGVSDSEIAQVLRRLGQVGWEQLPLVERRAARSPALGLRYRSGR